MPSATAATSRAVDTPIRTTVGSDSDGGGPSGAAREAVPEAHHAGLEVPRVGLRRSLKRERPVDPELIDERSAAVARPERVQGPLLCRGQAEAERTRSTRRARRPGASGPHVPRIPGIAPGPHTRAESAVGALTTSRTPIARASRPPSATATTARAASRSPAAGSRSGATVPRSTVPPCGSAATPAAAPTPGSTAAAPARRGAHRRKTPGDDRQHQYGSYPGRRAPHAHLLTVVVANVRVDKRRVCQCHPRGAARPRPRGNLHRARSPGETVSLSGKGNGRTGDGASLGRAFPSVKNRWFGKKLPGTFRPAWVIVCWTLERHTGRGGPSAP